MNASPSTLSRSRATIDLDKLAANYRTIANQVGGAEVAGVVKADGYGLGAAVVADRLWRQGCRRFFVAQLGEGMALRQALPTAEINVFDGVLPGTAEDLQAADLVPVLNSIEQIERWAAAAKAAGKPLSAGIHVDTGMLRLGLSPVEVRALTDRPELLAALDVRHIISHLASADDPASEQSEEQLARFTDLRRRFPMGVASLANSAGSFRGSAFHFDLVRPGIALYGGTPCPPGIENPMATVVTVEAPIIQVREAEPGEAVGYGASHRVDAATRIATIPVGYADGFLRSSSNRGVAAIGGVPVPIVGRISMDLITVDVGSIDPSSTCPGMPVELIGPAVPIDDVADRAGSLAYELLVNLSRRCERRYLG